MISEPAEPRDVNGSTAAASTKSTTSPALVGMAWLVVGIPAAWGIYMTVLTSIQLFHPTAANAPASTPAQVATPSAANAH